MNSRQLDLALKKQRLLLQSASQRAQLGAHVAGLAPVFAVADGAVAVADWVRQRPRWLVGTALVFAALRPRQAWRWGLRGLSLWQVLRRMRQH